MCGIAGTVNCSLNEADLSLIAHRGPDNRALAVMEHHGNRLFFGHTRLSIQDLSEAGNQPIFSLCNNYCMVFNGEIYNHYELRKKLKDIPFRGHSDTETILYYIREFGIEAVKDFVGIFALAFFDRIRGKVYLVRDQFGVKPLYYYQHEERLIFGSELKIILSNADYRKEIDTEAMNTFLTFRYNPAPQTLFKGIRKLSPAHYLEYTVSGGQSSLNPYWTSKPAVNMRISETEAVEEYKRLLENAVKRQLLSDVPVGLLLSGGVDSAVLGSLMGKYSKDPIKSFTVGFTGEGDYNELADARETARHIGSDHHEVIIEKKEYLDFFYKSFYHTEEPIAEPTIPALYYVARLASQYVKVVISGQGADEPMAGYKRYLGEHFISRYNWFLPFIPADLISKIFPADGTLARGLYASRFQEELDRFIAIYTLFTPDLKRKLYSPDYTALTDANQRPLFSQIFMQTTGLNDSLSKLLYLDTRTMLPDNLLLFNDKLTMANSLENRVPYLDITLVSFLESLPVRYKLRGNKGKYVHRKAASEWLPDSIINRKKRGFLTPIDEWLKSDFAGLLADIIESQDSLSRTYLNTGFIRTMIQQHKEQKKDYQRQLFIILSLELWYKHFFNLKY